MKHTEHRAHRWWNCRLTRRKSSFCCCCCQRSFESPFEDQGHEYKKEVEGTIFFCQTIFTVKFRLHSYCNKSIVTEELFAYDQPFLSHEKTKNSVLPFHKGAKFLVYLHMTEKG